MSTQPRVARVLSFLLVLCVLLPGSQAALPLSGGPAPALVGETPSLPEALGLGDVLATPEPKPREEGRLPEDWILRDRIVVGFEGDATALTPALAALLGASGGRLVRVDTLLDFAVAQVPEDEQASILKAAAALPGVRYAKADMRVEATFTPNDPLYSYQWGAPAIGMPQAWNVTRGDHNRTVAVLDTGVNASHPDLAPNMCVQGPDYPNNDTSPHDDHGHGTHVAGTVAAAIGNGVGVAGMSDACLMSVKVLDGGGSGTFADVASGIAWAADNGANVISMSLGGCPGCDPGAPVADAIQHAEDEGVLVVAAAGNAYCSPVSYPAAYPTVVAVAALQAPGNATAGFSSCGPEVFVSAPGAGIISTSLTSGPLSDPSGYMNLSGTSMATPHVAGVAALLWSHNLSLTHHDVRCILAQTADDLYGVGHDEKTGHGRIDAAAALASAQCTPSAPGPLALTAIAGSGGVHLSWSVPTSWGSALTGYNLYRGTDPGNLSLVETLPAGSTTRFDDGLANDVTYHYRIAGVNAMGEGDLSGLASATPQTPRALPFTDDVENGTAGWSATGLWHVTSDRYQSANRSWYYGQEHGAGLDDNSYSTGATNAGDLVSPPLDLTNATAASVRFWHLWEAEGGYWEHPIVQASRSPVGPWTTVAERLGQNGTGTLEVDLNAFLGDVTYVRFHWDTLDPVANDFEGWYVDDVEVVEAAATPTCEVGSDAFGNVCSVVPFDWQDVSGTGTPIPLGDDQVSGPIALPFNFSFYGAARSSVRVSSNGFLTFGEDLHSGCCSGYPIPYAGAPNNLVAGFWTDLFPAGAGIHHATLGAPGNRTFVVQFTDVDGYGNPATNATFQMRLVEATGDVEVHYLNATAAGYPTSAGIEDCNGLVGIQAAFGNLTLRETAFRYSPGNGTPPACNTPPTASFTSPAPGAVVQGVIGVTGVASDADEGDAVEQVQAGVWGWTSLSVNGTSNWTATLDTTTLPNGNHTLFAQAWDGTAWGPVAFQPIVIDNAPANSAPSATITNPSSGQVVVGLLNVTGTASDRDLNDSVENVSLRLDFSTSLNVTGTTNWTATLNTWTLPNGWHWLSASAFDGASWGPEHTVSFFVSNPPPLPRVSIASPTHNQTVAGPITISGTASPGPLDRPIVLVQVRLDGGEWRDAAGTTEWSLPLDTRGLADGPHVVEARSFDGWWVSNAAKVAFLVLNDGGPYVRIQSPGHGWTVGGVVLVSGSAGSGSYVELVEVRVDGGDWRPALGTTSWSRYLDTRSLSDGVHDVEARATDGDGNVSSVALVQVFVRNDAPPIVAIDTPAPDAVAGGLYEVRGRAFDPEGDVHHVEVLAGYGPWRTAFGREDWRITVDLRGYAEGTWVPILARPHDGLAYGETVLVYVQVSNRPDLVVTDLSVERGALHTDLGDLPNLVNEQRVIRVTVTNVGFGPAASNFSYLELTHDADRITPLSGSALGTRPIGRLAPGESRVFEIPWDTTRFVGDVTIEARVDAWNVVAERDESNNGASVQTWVRVGGIGTGVVV